MPEIRVDPLTGLRTVVAGEPLIVRLVDGGVAATTLTVNGGSDAVVTPSVTLIRMPVYVPV